MSARKIVLKVDPEWNIEARWYLQDLYTGEKSSWDYVPGKSLLAHTSAFIDHLRQRVSADTQFVIEWPEVSVRVGRQDRPLLVCKQCGGSGQVAGGERGEAWEPCPDCQPEEAEKKDKEKHLRWKLAAEQRELVKKLLGDRPDYTNNLPNSTMICGFCKEPWPDDKHFGEDQLCHKRPLFAEGPLYYSGTELKPCPFCGPGQSVVTRYQDEYGCWTVGCGRCGSHSGKRPRRDEHGADVVTRLWN